MIKAIVKDGVIQPVDPLPQHWQDGREVVVEEAEPNPTPQDLLAWNAALEALAVQFTAEDFEQFEQQLAAADDQAKVFVRRQMGL